MAHFAEIGANNKVLRVVVVADDVLLDSEGNPHEETGADYLRDTLGGQWKQCSYNTQGNTHREGGVPFRKHFPGGNFTYDEDRDAFIPPKPYASWVLNEDTCYWEPPIDYPTHLKLYEWDEEAYQADNTAGWVGIPKDDSDE